MKQRQLVPQESLNLIEAVEQFIKRCRAKNLSPRTIEWYEMILNRFKFFMKDIPLKNINQNNINEFMLSGKHLSSGTKAGWVRALKTFFKYYEIDIKIETVKQEKIIIKPFTTEQMKLILKQPNKNTFSGLRDYTLMMLLFDTGLRISEASNLRRRDINFNTNQLFVRGKGNKERFVPIGNICKNVLQDYLKTVKDIPDDYPVFISAYDNYLERSQINKRLKIYADKANITGLRISCHTFRHTFAKQFLMNGGDLFTLQKILGHSTLDMVRRYVTLIESDVTEQHQKFSPVDRLIGKQRRTRR